MATKKQIAVIADLVARAMVNLDNLAIDYTIIVRGVPKSFSNLKSERAAVALAQDHLDLQAKIWEERIQAEAERITALPE